MNIIAKNTNLQCKINNLTVKILEILGFNIITVCQDKNNVRIDYIIMTFGNLKDENSQIIHHA